MEKDTQINHRKSEHIRINLEEDVQSGLATGLERYSLIHQALPEINLDDVDLSQTIFGKRQPVPILVSSMTGGTDIATRINRNLAIAAQQLGLAMGVGSQRAAIENPALADTFNIRSVAPDILLFANLGAVQLNYGYGPDECRRAVDMIEADALILHLNPLQEALQPEGNHDFSHLAEKISPVVNKLTIPVIVKEVGWGISRETARRLLDIGVAAIDVAGAGGTSWSQVEMHRIDDPYRARTAAAFIDWGIPTADSILNIREESKTLPIIASGGLKTGIDIVKSLALGANLGGMAGLFLKAAVESEQAVIMTMQMILDQVRIAMFASGTLHLADLSFTKLIKKN